MGFQLVSMTQASRMLLSPFPPPGPSILCQDPTRRNSKHGKDKAASSSRKPLHTLQPRSPFSSFLWPSKTCDLSFLCHFHILLLMRLSPCLPPLSCFPHITNSCTSQTRTRVQGTVLTLPAEFAAGPEPR